MSRAGPGWPESIERISAATFGGIGNEDGFFGRGSEAEIGGHPLEMAQAAVGGFDDVGGAGEGDFVETVAAVDDDRPPGAEQEKRFGQQRLERGLAHAEELEFGRRRIDQRAEDVEDRGRGDFLSDGRDVFHRLMQERREAEADSQFVQTGFDALDAGLDIHAQRGENIGRAAAAGDAAIAVFGHGHAGGRGEQGRGRGDIECFRAVAAGAAGIEQARPTGANGRHAGAHRPSGAGYLFDGLAFLVQGDQQPGDLLFGTKPLHDLAESFGH